MYKIQAQQAASDAALAQARAEAESLGATLAEVERRAAAAEAEAERLAAAGDSFARQLAAAVLAQEAAQADALSARQAATQSDAELRARLAEALERAAAQSDQAAAAMSERDRQAALLATAQAQLTEQEALSAESQRAVVALNAQVAELRAQVASLQGLLDAANTADAAADVQIESLGADLNTALARVAQEERARAEAEQEARAAAEALAARLEAEARELQGYRSEFFGLIRPLLENTPGIRIDGDRFVFDSEVLFEPGDATLSPAGQRQIAEVSTILRQVIPDIPPEIDWIIRVDGHTDDVPLSGTGEFRDNWELSQARALSVVRQMADFEGIPPNRLSANGFGEFQPIDTSGTPEGRARNRRIEIKLTER